MAGGFTVHVGIAKPLLLTLIRNDGAEKVLVGWQGTTEEAIEKISADPRDFFVLDPTCNNQRSDGSCGTHPAPGSEPRADYTREELIEICERAVVAINKWGNRDSPHSHEKLGLCWVMLRAGAPFSIHQPRPGQSGCYTDDRTIWLQIEWHNFNDFEYGTKFGESGTFYLPTPERLNATKGRDWY